MGSLRSWPPVGLLILVFCIWIRTVHLENGGGCGPNPPCGPWEACAIMVGGRDVEFPYCVDINNCTGHDDTGCNYDEVCCGHGPDKCVCPSPKVRDKNGHCRECDCPWKEQCTVPHGECVCGDHEVRNHYGHCVDCDPDLSCPECGIDRVCTINQGDKTSTCECLPGSVERNGECVWCHPCPRDCDRDHVCITPGFAEPYCGCPEGMDEIDGKCVPCIRCPECTDGKECVVRGGKASCECPSGHIPHGWGCLKVPHPNFHKAKQGRKDNGRHDNDHDNGRHHSDHEHRP